MLWWNISEESSWKNKEGKANAPGGIGRGTTGGIYVSSEVRLGMGE